MAVTFDTLEYVNELKAADVPDKQAEAQAKALRNVLDATLENHTSALATKADLARLEATLLKWFIGTAIAMSGLAFAAAKWV